MVNDSSEDSLKKALRHQYHAETIEKTLKLGKLLSLIGVPAVLVFLLQDIVLLDTKDFVIWRLTALLPLALYLIMSFLVLQKYPQLTIACHTVALAGIMVMITGINVVVLLSSAYNYAYRIGVSSGFLVAAIIVFLFSGGSRNFLIPLLAIPIITLAVAYLVIESITTFELSFYTNPIIAVIGIIVLSKFRERMSFQEFRMRHSAEIKKKELEEKVEQVTDLNNQLNDALGKIKEEVNEKQTLEEELRTQVLIDDLTGVYNRRASIMFLDKMYNLSKRRKESLTICFLDIDNLKLVNDNLGHAEGDMLLKNVANALIESTRESDEVFRIGGDEFILILPDCAQKKAEEILLRVKDEIKRLTGEHGQKYKTDISYGFAEYTPGKEIDINTFIKIADNNMYRNKIRKKNRASSSDERTR